VIAATCIASTAAPTRPGLSLFEQPAGATNRLARAATNMLNASAVIAGGWQIK